MRGRLGSKAAGLGVAIALAACLSPAGATAKTGQLGSFGGVTVAGSPYRYAAYPPRLPGGSTTVARIERDGGRVSRWWTLPGSFFVPAVAADPESGGGLSGDGETLVLSSLWRTFPPRVSRFAILKTRFNYEWHGPGRPPHFRQFPKFVEVPGAYSLTAISPDGTTAYLAHYPISHRQPNPGPSDDFEIRALDLESGRLSPRRLTSAAQGWGPLTGAPITRASGSDGRWAYTLYLSDSRGPYLLALDTVAGRAIPVELPRLSNAANPILWRLRLEAGGRRLTVFSGAPNLAGSRRLLSVDTKTFAVREEAPIVTASSDAGSPWPPIALVGAWSPTRASSSLAAPPRHDFLAFTQTPRHPGNLLLRAGVAGHSAEGRRIGLRQAGDPALEGEVLVFGCVHGDECAASGIEPLTNGCPDPSADLYLVPNLDPDGAAQGTRLNGRGVDLNRNFPSGWKPLGRRGDPQYSGPHPFSEPETRLAARIIRRLQPRVTVWFHQHAGPALVRAWGQSAPAARHLARLAGLPFYLLPWPAGTAPNWQNHRFPGTSSFVVELPPGPLAGGLESRLGRAIVQLGRKVGED